MELRFSKHAVDAIIERMIDRDWIERTIERPMRTHSDDDDPELSHYLLKIPENGNRVLRVVVNTTKTPYEVVTTFFDRRMKNKL